MLRGILLVGLVVIVAAGCGGGGGSHPVAMHLRVTPAASVEDQPIRIRFDGLKRLQGVWLELRSTDATGTVFVSRAAFGANEQGVLDLNHAKALTGSSYSGVWPMGLLTSMSAPNALPLTSYSWGTTPRRFVLTATTASVQIASVTFTRRWRRGTYTKLTETVAKNGFDATFYAPAGARRQPAVLAIGGAEGGHGSAWLGERLAAAGIPALVVGYFHAPGLPDKLVNIPLEYFRTALEWLGRRPEVDSGRVSVLGTSHGSEAALLLGAHYPSLVHSVAALVPSSVVTCGIVGASRVTLFMSKCLGSPWTLDRRPLPFTHVLSDPRPRGELQAVIPVERIRSPVFVACGGRDQIWSSCSYARAIAAARRAHGESTQLLVYPNASHDLGRPYVYAPGAIASDFFIPADERSREDLWPRLLAFLRAT